jgi:hypothetical protein
MDTGLRRYDGSLKFVSLSNKAPFVPRNGLRATSRYAGRNLRDCVKCLLHSATASRANAAQSHFNSTISAVTVRAPKDGFARRDEK